MDSYDGPETDVGNARNPFSAQVSVGRTGVGKVGKAASAFQCASQTMMGATELARQCTELRDRLIGPIPETTGNDEQRPEETGHLNELRQKARATDEVMVEGMRALQQIRDALD